MNNMRQFFNKYGASIMTVVVVFITILTVFSMLGINLNPKKDKHIQKVVTIESLDNLDSYNETVFCDKFMSEPHKINEHCNKLTASNCKAASCCVLLNGKNCAAGDKHGPTFHTKNGKDIEVDYYYHKSQCYGEQCS